ncbi:MAG: NAD(P)/FAD-dependent oxidoreductase [Candidatus Omnitrophota bacterium]
MKKDEYDVIIIGAGIGGLATGNILAKNGMKVLILEKNPVPGGAVTTYYKNGYPIDICHAICAMDQDGFLGKIFNYLGILKELDLVKLDKAFICFSNEQKLINCYANYDKYKFELFRFFPRQVKSIEKILNKIKITWDHEILKTYYAPNILKLILYPLFFPYLFQYRNFTFEKFLNNFTKNDELKEIISIGWPYLGLKKEAVSALYMFCLIGAYHKEGCYFIKGGFGKITELLANNFKKLGGVINLNCKVFNILIKNKKAYGVQLADNYQILANKIISNIDTRKTFLNLINVKEISPKLLKRVKLSTLSCSSIQVHLCAKASISPEFLSTGTIVLPFSENLEWKLKKYLHSNFNLNSEQHFALSINSIKNFNKIEENNIYIFNIVLIPASYNLWNSFYNNYGKEEYQILKEEMAQEVIKQIKKIWNIESIKFSNVLTPLSVNNWMDSSEGAIYDFAAFPRQMLLNRFKNSTEIKDLYLVGAKTFPGAGMAGALLSATYLCDKMLNYSLTKGRFTL